MWDTLSFRPQILFEPIYTTWLVGSNGTFVGYFGTEVTGGGRLDVIKAKSVCMGCQHCHVHAV